MINCIYFFFTNKEIILYDNHRNTKPLAEHKGNLKNYVFVNIASIWKLIPFKSSNKRKYQIMYFLLNIIQPKYIISMNWLSKRESLYKVWTTKKKKSKFIVVQHGSYVGGVVTDVPHKYTKCDVFLTWGTFFVEQFKSYNYSKNVEIINFGNTLYNTFDRDCFVYKKNITNKVLILPTALNQEGVLYFKNLIEKLQELGFEVILKEHGKQGVVENNNIKYPVINYDKKITGHLHEILQIGDYDFIITDHSSALLDAIFFRNKVIYFDPNNDMKDYTTLYSKYLCNLYLKDLSVMSKYSFYELLNVEKQELLFNNMVTLGDNKVDYL